MDQNMEKPPMYQQHNVQIVSAKLQGDVKFGWCPLVTTLFAAILCPLCGIPGMAAAILSYTDHKAKEYDRATHKKSVALGCGITGVVLAMIWILWLIITYAMAVARVRNGFYY